jgi:hypothetical protein
LFQLICSISCMTITHYYLMFMLKTRCFTIFVQVIPFTIVGIDLSSFFGNPMVIYILSFVPPKFLEVLVISTGRTQWELSQFVQWHFQVIILRLIFVDKWQETVGYWNCIICYWRQLSSMAEENLCGSSVSGNLCIYSWLYTQIVHKRWSHLYCQHTEL